MLCSPLPMGGSAAAKGASNPPGRQGGCQQGTQNSSTSTNAGITISSPCLRLWRLQLTTPRPDRDSLLLLCHQARCSALPLRLQQRLHLVLELCRLQEAECLLNTLQQLLMGTAGLMLQGIQVLQGCCHLGQCLLDKRVLQAGRLSGRLSGRQAGMHASRQAGKQASRRPDGQAV